MLWNKYSVEGRNIFSPKMIYPSDIMFLLWSCVVAFQDAALHMYTLRNETICHMWVTSYLNPMK